MPTDETSAEAVEPVELAEPARCPVCGAEGALTELPDGSTYCAGHRGLTIPGEPPQAPLSVPDELGAPMAHLAAPGTPASDEGDGGPEELPWALDPAVQMVAGLIYASALATFHADGTYGDPPLGWAPPPADASPHVEAGAVLAVAVLIEAAEIDRDVIQTLARTFMGEPIPTGEPTDD